MNGPSVQAPIGSASSEAPVTARPASSYRWRICALLFFGTTLNYIDRQVLSILAPQLQELFAWQETDYAAIVASFNVAYAIGLVLTGGILDRIGTRAGYGSAVSLWSLAAMGHAIARTVAGFSIARFALGLSEAANFPAAIKTVAEWFPKKERAFAVGIFNSGSNVGAIVAPLLVPIIAVSLGWQAAFLITGAAGFVWLIFWLAMYRRPEVHPNVSASELAFIQADGIESQVRVPWLRLLPHRETLTVCLLKFLTDPVWWFFLFWLPKFLNERHGVSLLQLGPPLIAIYLAADVGSIAGGWLSSHFIKRGMSVGAARKTTIFIAGLFALPIFYASRTDSLWVAVTLIAMGTAAHQACSANIFTTMSDVFPKRVVASVVGLAGMSGAIAGALVATFVGYILQTTGSYTLIFAMFSGAYLLAWAVLSIGIPRFDQVKL